MRVLQWFFIFPLVQSRNCQCRSKRIEKAFNERNPKAADQSIVVPEEEGPTVQIVEHEVVDVSPEPQPTKKRFEIVNSCSFEVQLGVTGSDKGPSKNGSCADNQKDNGHGRCFWYFEDYPESLRPGEKWRIDLGSDDDHIFSGNVWGVKTGMMKGACPSGICLPWVGPRGAVTKAEFTLSKNGLDYYDVSIIEGANLPVAMYPSTVAADPNDRYMCGIAGGCAWDFNPELDLQKYVTQVIDAQLEATCVKDSDCTSGQVCGATFDTRPPTYGVCGTFTGYASAHVNCLSGSTGAPFFCEDNSNVISCMGDYNLSGYNQPPGTKVCGCPDWESMGIDAPTHSPCETTDKNWEQRSLPFLKFLKRGCPLVYVFAFDDLTSTATCDTSRAYTIEFCPNDSENNFFK